MSSCPCRCGTGTNRLGRLARLRSKRNLLFFLFLSLHNKQRSSFDSKTNKSCPRKPVQPTFHQNATWPISNAIALALVGSKLSHAASRTLAPIQIKRVSSLPLLTPPTSKKSYRKLKITIETIQVASNLCQLSVSFLIPFLTNDFQREKNKQKKGREGDPCV